MWLNYTVRNWKKKREKKKKEKYLCKQQSTFNRGLYLLFLLLFTSTSQNWNNNQEFDSSFPQSNYIWSHTKGLLFLSPQFNVPRRHSSWGTYHLLSRWLQYCNFNPSSKFLLVQYNSINFYRLNPNILLPQYYSLAKKALWIFIAYILIFKCTQHSRISTI